jgi:hypothetical protein
LTQVEEALLSPTEKAIRQKQRTTWKELLNHD